jgi:hypothetical protein
MLVEVLVAGDTPKRGYANKIIEIFFERLRCRANKDPVKGVPKRGRTG